MCKLLFLLTAVIFASGCAANAAGIPSPTPVMGDAQRGEQIFRTGKDGSPPCITCHKVTADAVGFSLGPNLARLSERASARVEGLTVEQYIHQSILDPYSYIVPGYRNIMYPQYSEHFDDQDIADLTAFLLTL